MAWERKGSIIRETAETHVSAAVNLDGSGVVNINTGIGMLDHLLEQVARHGYMDIDITAQGDLGRGEHHLVEDVAIGLGRALVQALGERQGIVRMAHALVPMDEALALVALDLSGRGHATLELVFSGQRMGGLPCQLVGHFLSSLAVEGRLTLHARILAGQDDHHRAEALFKALGRALGEATRLDPCTAGRVPSTKETLD